MCLQAQGALADIWSTEATQNRDGGVFDEFKHQQP